MLRLLKISDKSRKVKSSPKRAAAWFPLNLLFQNTRFLQCVLDNH